MNIIRSWNDRTIRIREDRYVSLTDMAQACGKNVNDFLRLSKTKSYLDVLSTKTGNPVMAQNEGFQALIETKKGGSSPETTGTWGHPKVAIRFAQWCSDDFAVQVDCWIDELLTTGSVTLQPQTSYYFDRLKQFLKDGKVPVGYFCVFRETLELVGDLEGRGCILPQSVTPDLSVGICWANHLRSIGIEPRDVSIKYSHRFPNDPRGTVKPYAYEDHLLAGFRKWFHHQYQTEKLPKYLKGKYPDALPALSSLLGIPEKILLKLK